MVYLLDEWFVDKSHEQRVRELIDELKTDIKDDSARSDDEIILDIVELGETTIAELLKQNSPSRIREDDPGIVIKDNRRLMYSPHTRG